jgi:hypothetical protein
MNGHFFKAVLVQVASSCFAEQPQAGCSSPNAKDERFMQTHFQSGLSTFR